MGLPPGRRPARSRGSLAAGLLLAGLVTACGQRASDADEAQAPVAAPGPEAPSGPLVPAPAVRPEADPSLPLRPQAMRFEEFSAVVPAGLGCSWREDTGAVLFVASAGARGQRGQGVIKLDGELERLFTAGPIDHAQLALGGPFQGEGIALLVEPDLDAQPAMGEGGAISRPAGLFFEAGGWAWESRRGEWVCGP